MFRKTAPKYGDIQMPVIPEFANSTLPNGVQLHVMRGGAQPVVKIDIFVRAGGLRSDRSLIARATANMLIEGSIKHTSDELAQMIDFYGAYAWPSIAPSSATYSLCCLSKDVHSVLPLIEEIIKTPTFPAEEVELYVAQELQNFDVNMMRTAFVASREMLSAIFAPGDRNGRVAQREDYANVRPEFLKEFHSLAYKPAGTHIFVSGLPSDDDVRVISDTFGSNWEGGEVWKTPMPKFNDEAQQRFVPFKGEQTSLRMVRPLFSRSHPDYMAFVILNVAFGGYFGSRLMQTLREKLGLTYGVSSSAAVNKLYGQHVISTEIKNGSHSQAIDVIKDEMRKLANEPVSPAEMENIRGTLLGELLRNFDSAMTAADTLTNYIVDEVPISSYREYYDLIKSITPEQLMDVAARWLDPDKYSVICVGEV